MCQKHYAELKGTKVTTLTQEQALSLLRHVDMLAHWLFEADVIIHDLIADVKVLARDTNLRGIPTQSSWMGAYEAERWVKNLCNNVNYQVEQIDWLMGPKKEELDATEDKSAEN